MLNGAEKATILLSIIGPQRAARVLRRLPEEVADLLSSRIASMPQPSPDMIARLYKEMMQNRLQAAQRPRALEAPKPQPKKEPVSEPVVIVEPVVDKPVERVDEFRNPELSTSDRFNRIPAKIMARILTQEKPMVQNFVVHLLPVTKAADVKKDLKNETTVNLEVLPVFDDFKNVLIDKIVRISEDKKWD